MCQKYKLRIVLVRFLSTVVLTLYGFHIHLKDHAQFELCESSVYSREIINMLFVCQVYGPVKNFNIGIFWDTINVINVKLYMIVLFIKLYMFKPHSLILNIFQVHSSVEQF